MRRWASLAHPIDALLAPSAGRLRGSCCLGQGNLDREREGGKTNALREDIESVHCGEGLRRHSSERVVVGERTAGGASSSSPVSMRWSTVVVGGRWESSEVELGSGEEEEEKTEEARRRQKKSKKGGRSHFGPSWILRSFLVWD